MNLYLLLTIALGIPDVTVRTRAVTPVVVGAHVQRSIAISLAVRRSPFAVGVNGEQQTANGEPVLTTDAPLTGSSTPRAPAQIG